MTSAMPETAPVTETPVWIVECPQYHPGEYFALCDCGCARHYWTKDVHRAAKFATKDEAEKARGGDHNCIAVEHLFGLTLPPNSATPVTEMGIEPLVERLRRSNVLHLGNGPVETGVPLNPDGPEAADLIEQLASTRTPEAAQVDILREALIEARGELVRLRERYGTAHSEVVVSRIDTALAQVCHPLEKEG